MGNKDYLTVKDVAEMLETEAYVLRFYEKELNLHIKRNSKGHRIYTLEDVELLKQVQEMREQGLQLKAIESIVHDEVDKEAQETYEQLSSIQVAPISVVKRSEPMEVEITDADNEKVKLFSGMMKDMLKEALVEYGEESQEEIKREIEKKVDVAVEEKLAKMEEAQNEKNEEYYRKLDEAMREVQKMRKEMAEAGQEENKQKSSFWSKLFKEKNKGAEI